jgi:hypothetical protein
LDTHTVEIIFTTIYIYSTMGQSQSKQEVINESVTNTVLNAMATQSQSGVSTISQQIGNINIGGKTKIRGMEISQVASINLALLTEGSQSAQLASTITQDLIAKATQSSTSFPLPVNNDDEQIVKNIVKNNIDAQAKIVQENKLDIGTTQTVGDVNIMDADVANVKIIQKVDILANLSSGITNGLMQQFASKVSTSAEATQERKTFISDIADVFGNLGMMGLMAVVLVVVIAVVMLSVMGSAGGGAVVGALTGPSYHAAHLIPRPNRSAVTGYSNDERWNYYNPDHVREMGRRPAMRLAGGAKSNSILPFPLDTILPTGKNKSVSFNTDVSAPEDVIDIKIKDVDNEVKINQDTTLADAYPKPKEVEVDVTVNEPSPPVPMEPTTPESTPSEAPPMPIDMGNNVAEPELIPTPKQDIGVEAQYVINDPSEEGALPNFNPKPFTIDGNAFQGGDYSNTTPQVPSSSYLYNTQNYNKQPVINNPGSNTTFQYYDNKEPY